ncbi:hypothetical protein [Paenibacillus crassostreae]|uniref:Adhesin domain-containing protein n=1 Tax=Paenibacillus crassostreae TaxID=1763538 RepID=A0A167BTC9_9BACL|nr:hypothetical protein [Paenibacillus crassostreae]AOZ92474.1 hypothetical protein LPB68_09655 [Paenibacillus crassostreae]OAB72422.1 hypothetical protein PNBC_16100 [Paenibacillus crassostreae]
MHRKPKFLKVMIVTVVSLVILAGCTNETDEMFKTGIGEVTEAIGDTAQNISSDWSAELKKDGLQKEISLTQEVGSASTLNMDNAVGNIEVIAATDDNLIVNATLSFPKSSLREAKYQEILDQAEVSVVVQGDQLKIVTHPQGNSKKSLWTWAEDKYGFSEFSIDYKVELPDSVNQFDLTNNVGELTLRNLKGNYDVVSDVGTINIEGAQIQGESTVQSDVGRIQLGIEQMESDSSLKVNTEVGGITTTLAGTLQCSLNVESDLGQITGVNKGKSDINGGGPLLSLTSAVGSIAVERP